MRRSLYPHIDYTQGNHSTVTQRPLHCTTHSRSLTQLQSQLIKWLADDNEFIPDLAESSLYCYTRQWLSEEARFLILMVAHDLSTELQLIPHVAP